MFSPSPKATALVEIRAQARNDICAGSRVPKILVGSMTEATYANAQEARRFMLEDHTIPRSRYYAERINADLVRRIDPTVRFRFAPEQLPILQEGANAKWERLRSAADGGAISWDFARQQMGWPESAAPATTPVPSGPAGPPDLSPEQSAERAWLRKAKNALKAGRPAGVSFDTPDLSQTRQQAIRARLADATTAAEAEKAFGSD